MNLKEKIQHFKQNIPDRLEHTFKDGSKFKGYGNHKVHKWIDLLYIQAVNEWHEKKTQNNAEYISKLI